MSSRYKKKLPPTLSHKCRRAMIMKILYYISGNVHNNVQSVDILCINEIPENKHANDNKVVYE
ncbi:hypothetical protein DERF_007250 [Dermatophagoides farinae]|uniref:Uncharacterized protein n=1 Tax=Dermatophagoides farinae TaxID=6954 RepID=A0A922I324_DERFA|nr:hypothetical protein DERF_007250 [Dermatophagoides farinae]